LSSPQISATLYPRKVPPVRKTIWLIFLWWGALNLAGCSQSCEGLTPAQCANQGTHEYTRTYEFTEGCGVEAAFIEGVSEITWTFSPQGDSVEFPNLFPEGPPTVIELVNVEPDAYRPALDEPGESLIRLSEEGFVWIYFDPATGGPCYQVVFTLEV
jgi:hypothetical protein